MDTATRLAPVSAMSLNSSYIGDLYSSNTSGNHTNHPNSLSIDKLYPAIIQCFVIILAGYIAGRANLITQTQGKGIGTFVGKFCLPALLFKSMVELNFDTVNWYFLLGIGISKTAVFMGVMALTLLVKRPVHLGYAGLFAIFATQSNDFALGYPILKALYEDTNPEYLQYIYLIAPISLVLLNPIGFTLLEVHRHKQESDVQRSKLSVMVHVIIDVLSNPIVFMVIIGIAGNFVFKQNIPTVIGDILEVLGNAYSASALFYLGLSLVGKVQGQLGVGLIVPLLLITAKTLLLPLITWQVVGALAPGKLNDTHSLSMYGFLYGTFPTAPSVFLYASQFAVAQDVIATGMVACTFLSAPLMFVSAKMMTVVVDGEMDYKRLLQSTSFDFSIISLICSVWVLALLFFSRKHKKMPHHFLICLVFSQMLSCIGMIVYDGIDTKIAWKHYIQFVILLVGVFSTRCFTAIISIVVFLLHCRSLCYVLRIKIWMYFFGVGFPVVCTGLLILAGTHHMHDEIDPSFHYGVDQAILSIIVLGLCSIINITFLVMKQRSSRLHGGSKFINSSRLTQSKNEEDSPRQKLLPDDEDSREPESPSRTRSSSRTKLLDDTDRCETGNGYQATSCSRCTEDCDATLYNQSVPVRQNSTSIEDIVPFPSDMQRHRDHATAVDSARGTSMSRSSSNNSTSSIDSFTDTMVDRSCKSGTCNYQQRRACAQLLRCYEPSRRTLQIQGDGDVRVKQPKTSLKDEYQTNRFIVLLCVLQISMFMGLFLCTWRLFNNRTSGIYIEIEFLDSFFNYGQSLVVFAIFGFDTRLMILPCLKSAWFERVVRFYNRWRQYMYGTEAVHVPAKSKLPEDEKRLCERFIKYHKQNSIKDIVRDRKYRFRTYKAVFCGTVLCDWLIEVGLSRDRQEAIVYGQTLLRGQVISHVTKEHDFHDMPYFYHFLEDEELEGE